MSDQPEVPLPDFIIELLAPYPNSPPQLLAHAELHFITGPLKGIRFVGFGIWEARVGYDSPSVSFPSRPYVTVYREERNWPLVRPIDEHDEADQQACADLKHRILMAYADEIAAEMGPTVEGEEAMAVEEAMAAWKQRMSVTSAPPPAPFDQRRRRRRRPRK